MSMKIWKPLHPRIEIETIEVQDEEEEGGDYLFDPEAGRASEDPFAHLDSQDAPDESAASEEKVSKYVKGEEE